MIASAESSFEHNQSLPVLNKPHQRPSLGFCAKGVENLTGDEYDSYSYRRVSGFSNQSARTSAHNSLVENSMKDESNSSFVKEKQRALFTISDETWKILTVNKIASELCGFSPSELINKDFRSLLETNTDQDSCCQENGGEAFPPPSGKILDLLHKNGFLIPVSIWSRHVGDSTGAKRCIIVMEPVERISCLFDFNEQGDIIYCDEKFMIFHGLQTSDLDGLSLSKLMPCYVLPAPGGNSISKDMRLQYTTSTMRDGLNFAVTVFINSQAKTKKLSPAVNSRPVIYKAKMWIFPHASGTITCKSNGDINSLNGNLAQHVFGYSLDEVAKMNIKVLIPNLFDQESNGSLYNSAVPQIEMDSSLNFSCQEDDNMKPKNEGDTTVESWVEVSLLSNGERDKMGDSELSENKERVEENHSDFLSKINALLNNSGKLTELPEQQSGPHLTASNKCKEVSTNSDSAIHSTCSSCKILKNEKNCEKGQTSFSDYHSADGSQTAVPAQMNDRNPPRGSRDSAISCQHNQSSFVVLEDDTHADVFHTDQQQNPNNIAEKICGKPLKRLPIGSEVTSTPLEYARAVSRISDQETSFNHLRNGFYKGKYKHKHGALIDFAYEFARVDTVKGHGHLLFFRVYSCTKLNKDYSIDALNSTVCTSASTLPSLSTSNKSSLLDTSSLNDSHGETEANNDKIQEKLAISGEFSDKYTLLKRIGSGAFGFVQIAKCKTSTKEFVVKFIKKEKILDECWVHDDELDSLIPMEITLLLNFRHPHIIQILDFFENTNYFSMVMPKHGIHGIDLFEFIDRSNNGVDKSVEEPLASFIFRQVVSAVSYLHARSILHRDIKDENIIIDEKFMCKLIDFGSATFMKAGKEFATFCGTIEYCSPEVLMGNTYRGPELEMWALGVTLYTLVFGENPFKNVEETVACEVDPPFAVSRELAILLQSLLRPDPEFRCTMKELLENSWLNQPVNVEDYNWDDVVQTPAGSLNASRVHDEYPSYDSLEQENLCQKLEKLSTAASKDVKDKRSPFKSISNLNNTI